MVNAGTGLAERWPDDDEGSGRATKSGTTAVRKATVRKATRASSVRLRKAFAEAVCEIRQPSLTEARASSQPVAPTRCPDSRVEELSARRSGMTLVRGAADRCRVDRKGQGRQVDAEALAEAWDPPTSPTRRCACSPTMTTSSVA